MHITDKIEVNREIMHGKPVIAETRIPVYIVLGLLSDGISPEEIIRDYYPHLTKEYIMACLKYACTLLEEEVLEKNKELKGLSAEDLIQCDSINFREDPVLYQKRLRDEW